MEGGVRKRSPEREHRRDAPLVAESPLAYSTLVCVPRLGIDEKSAICGSISFCSSKRRRIQRTLLCAQVEHRTQRIAVRHHNKWGGMWCVLCVLVCPWVVAAWLTAQQECMQANGESSPSGLEQGFERAGVLTTLKFMHQSSASAFRWPMPDARWTNSAGRQRKGIW